MERTMSQDAPQDDYGAAAEFYDYVPPYSDRADIDFWVTAAVESGGPVLELGCGTGRVLIPTARAGVEIAGLDLSRSMLGICERKLSREPPQVAARVTLLEADMRRFELGRQFALATMPFRPFQHLITVEDQIACLETIHRHLMPAGRLILDLFNPFLPALVDESRHSEYGDEPEFGLPDGRQVVRRFRTARQDWLAQVQDVELIYYVTHPDGRQERFIHSFPMRYLFRFEAEHLLARCGFRVEALYADYDRSPYGSIYPGELIFVAEK
jgi:SAM-dependent methyltransferase